MSASGVRVPYRSSAISRSPTVRLASRLGKRLPRLSDEVRDGVQFHLDGRLSLPHCSIAPSRSIISMKRAGAPRSMRRCRMPTPIRRWGQAMTVTQNGKPIIRAELFSGEVGYQVLRNEGQTHPRRRQISLWYRQASAILVAIGHASSYGHFNDGGGLQLDFHHVPVFPYFYIRTPASITHQLSSS